jgi:hypothetical protein
LELDGLVNGILKLVYAVVEILLRVVAAKTVPTPTSLIDTVIVVAVPPFMLNKSEHA